MKNILIDKQKKLVSKICLDNKIDINNLHTIAGVDLAYWKKEGKEYECCCIVAIDYESKAVVEKKYSIGEVNIPYISGCLAFREYELVERTISLLENQVELFVFDGNGYLHPRHMGLATYAGIMLNVPSIGIAKSFYKFVKFDYSDLSTEKFAYKDIVRYLENMGEVASKRR